MMFLSGKLSCDYISAVSPHFLQSFPEIHTFLRASSNFPSEGSLWSFMIGQHLRQRSLRVDSVAVCFCSVQKAPGIHGGSSLDPKCKGQTIKPNGKLDSNSHIVLTTC